MEGLRCYRCSCSLESLSLPLSRLDECPQCETHLHVCRMCVYFAPRLPKACREDDALEVRDKTNANFCDYFKPAAGAFDPALAAADARARAELGALFGSAGEDSRADADDSHAPGAGSDATVEAAQALFKK